MPQAPTPFNIDFKPLKGKDTAIVFRWLSQDFVQAFWDNSQEHKDDILNFVEGRKTLSSYAEGKYMYWIASFKHEPFALLMTIQETQQSPIGLEKRSQLSKTGNTYSLDYMIGNPRFLGKGYGAQTLSVFIDYFRATSDSTADTFLVDPASDNPRAKHVYIKAGFEYVCDFTMEESVSGKGKVHHLLTKRFSLKPLVLPPRIIAP